MPKQVRKTNLDMFLIPLGLENRSSRFEPKNSWLSFSRGSGPPLNGNRNPEWWGDFSQLVKIDKIRFLGISQYKIELRFWLDLNSEVSRGTNSNWDFCLIWICSWPKSAHHSGFRLPLKVWLGISRTNADSQWNPVYNVFHRNFCCGNETIRR